MDLVNQIKSRRSIRAYKPDKIDKKTLENIVDCGRLSATAMNIQPWHFVVITENDTLKKISDQMNHSQFVGSASACILVVCDKDAEYYLEDGSAASENILLAAHSMGLGACWVAGDKQEYHDQVLNVIEAPKGSKLVSIIAIGIADEEPKNEPKKKLDEVLHWEKY